MKKLKLLLMSLAIIIAISGAFATNTTGNPCANPALTKYFTPNIEDPVTLGVYGEDWECRPPIRPACYWVFDEDLQDFVSCDTGTPTEVDK